MKPATKEETMTDLIIDPATIPAGYTLILTADLERVLHLAEFYLSLAGKGTAFPLTTIESTAK